MANLIPPRNELHTLYCGCTEDQCNTRGIIGMAVLKGHELGNVEARTRLIAEMASRIAAGLVVERSTDSVSGVVAGCAVDMAERILQRVEGGGGE